MSTVELAGELTIHAAAEQAPRLLAALEEKSVLRVRLADVTEIDTAGLQILLLTRREAARIGSTVEFRDASPAVREALAIVHLDPALEAMS
ncbi:STAS domain-containing protein [Catenuloplanes indicus]|uniref:Anti-anti-sigma factor n=1 Tax=Catenuloplanes indicus TaxID=137267 RepID=A0AAE4B4I4_9ACTN|nr:STAS domain-containing protein [Catenuloplanes indicus]MDQ0371463.1 anti-anti-sigma factor [Catenuloplanes indicus]